jgi:cobalt-zinc-cadmium efflux system membrane fusion protein
MYMNAEIEIQNNTVYALPEEAIVRFENNQYVFLAETDTRFTIQEIKTGDVEKGFVEIISGVGLTDKKIVIKGAYNLLMAMKNKVEE